jgi:sodium-dependent dicarboxylate transporter 2/3/5
MSFRVWSTAGGLVLATITYAATWHAGMPANQCATAAVTALCATWWIFEALPLPATSLVPLVAFPLAGVLTERQVAAAYADPVVLLFMGGFMISKAAEKWGAHRRLAELMLTRVGATSGPRVVLAFMLATALVSMWISNTATALMMMPVALAVLERDGTGRLAVPLLLGVGYSASIGGIATPIGTPPNGIFLAVYRTVAGRGVPFHEWMIFAVPVALLMLVSTWTVLCWRLHGIAPMEVPPREKWTTAQKRTLAVFGLAALAWITREVPYGGWSGLFNTNMEDMSVAIAAVVLLFFIPSGERDGDQRGGRLLDWQTAASIPWGVLILFGGGIAIAGAFENSGLSMVIGEKVQGLRELPLVATMAIVCLAVTFLSEVTSNTATSNILMPILAAAAKANGLEPALLMIPATLSNSLAFMMPVGTPPNAIVYASGHVRIADMVKAGLVLNLIGAAIVTLVCWWLLPMVFGGSGHAG